MRTLCLAHRATPLGEMLLASEGEALVGAWFAGQRYYAVGISEGVYKESPAIRVANAWLSAYFGGECPGPSELPPLAPVGTPYREAVWKLLRDIPFGQTTTYGSIAHALRHSGRKASAQSVGQAIGHNPISIMIPCHRVIGATGTLTGYAGGAARKQWLLQHESNYPLTLCSTTLRPS